MIEWVNIKEKKKSIYFICIIFKIVNIWELLIICKYFICKFVKRCIFRRIWYFVELNIVSDKMLVYI